MQSDKLSECAAELGRRGAKARWASKPAKSKPAKSKPAKSKPAKSSALATIPRPWSTAAAKGVKVDVRPVGGAARAIARPPLGLPSGERKAAPARRAEAPARPSAAPASPWAGWSGRTPSKTEAAALRQQIAELRQQRYGENSVDHRVVMSEYIPGEDSGEFGRQTEPADMALVRSQAGKLGLVFEMTDGLVSSSLLPFAMPGARINGLEGYGGFRVRIEGSNAPEHLRNIARAIMAGMVAAQRVLGAEFFRMVQVCGLAGPQAEGQVEHVAGEKRRVPASADGRKRVWAAMMVTPDDARATAPAGSPMARGDRFVAIAHAAVAVFRELQRLGYSLASVVSLRQLAATDADDDPSLASESVSLDEAVTRLSSVVFEPSWSRNGDQASSEWAAAEPPPSAGDDGKRQRQAPKPKAGAAREPSKKSYEYINDRDAAIFVEALVAVGASTARINAVMSAIQSWLADGGSASVTLDTPEYRMLSDGSGDFYQDNDTPGVEGVRSTSAPDGGLGTIRSGGGELESLQITLKLDDETVGGSLRDLNVIFGDAIDSAKGVGFRAAGNYENLPTFIRRAQFEEFRFRRAITTGAEGQLWQMNGVFRLTIGYSKRLAAMQGSKVRWEPPGKIKFQGAKRG